MHAWRYLSDQQIHSVIEAHRTDLFNVTNGQRLEVIHYKRKSKNCCPYVRLQNYLSTQILQTLCD